VAIIQINGKEMPYVTALSLKLTDVMTENSGRVKANAKARIEYIRCDVFGADLEFPNITEQQLKTVLNEIGTNNENAKFFTVTFSIGGLELITNRTCYPGDRTITLTSNANGEPRYTLAFSVAEK
jgi:hypothetical protein